jgi:CDP-diglyceride synthetase
VNSSEISAFLTASLLFSTVSFGAAYLSGNLVERFGLRVNYSRKINHFITVGFPWVLQQSFKLDQNLTAVALAAIVTPMHLAVYVKPIRDRIPVVATMFRSFDRPEDRPHTLSWLATQYAAVFIVYFGMYAVLLYRGVAAWMLIPIIVNVVGDGLAEPVGVAFGTHPYRCGALFTRRRYVRTWEGSACVFLSAVAGIFLCGATLSPIQLGLALAVVPLSAALGEAVSPHTWDAPFLFFILGGELVLLSFV